MSGKGSSPRPISVSDQEYAERWDAIFGKDKKAEKPAQLDLLCAHEVWTHNGTEYECLECGTKSEAGPYLSR